MDDEADAWDYSFPPSTENLPAQTSQTTLQQESSSLHVVMPADTDDSDSGTSASELAASNAPSNDFDTSLPPDISSRLPVPTLGKNDLTALLGNTNGQLLGVYMLKSMPANPQTTKQEASSIILKDSSCNALAAGAAIVDNSGTSPPATPSVKSDFRDSVRIWQLKTAESEPKTDDGVSGNDDTLLLRKTFGTLAPSPFFTTSPNQSEPKDDSLVSPKIITYRKTNHQRTESELYDAALRQERYDPKLYVDEKFGLTSYRYATMKRNVEFHQLFRSIDLTDRLLDDFACALSREILLQGRIYVTEHCICFNLNLLGWVTSLAVPFTDVVRIDKKLTAGLFPNGISIETRESKHNFASFLLRDATYDFFRAIWLEATGKQLEELDMMAPESVTLSLLQNARNILNYILLIDDDDHNSDFSDDVDENEDEDDTSESASEEENISVEHFEKKVPDMVIERKLLTVETHLRRLLPDSPYKNTGPDMHLPTTVTQDFSDAENETEICKEVFDAPMGIVFDIMFGTNTTFQRHFLSEHDASEIDDYDAFHPVEDEPTKLERTYTYRRALGYLIGPKSTKCEVREVIEHLNYADYIVVLNTTATPDVPSGGSFTVKTRYYFTWAPSNCTQVRIAYYVKWTGRSWIKNVVEKLTHGAQTAVAADLMKEVRAEIEKNTTLVNGPTEVIEEPVVEKPKKRKKSTKKAVPEPAPKLPFTGLVVFFLVLLLGILLMQVRLMRQLSETRDMVARQALLTAKVANVVSKDNIVNIEKDMSPKERASYWAQQAMQLLDDGLL